MRLFCEFNTCFREEAQINLIFDPVMINKLSGSGLVVNQQESKTKILENLARGTLYHIMGYCCLMSFDNNNALI